MLDDFGQRIRDIILSEMDLSRELSDEEICDLIGSVVSREARDRPMTIKDRAELERTIFNSLRKLDVLQELVDDRDVTEIMVNGPNDIFYEKAGRIQRFKGHFSSEEKLEDVIQQIVGRHNRVVNQASPIVDTRLSDGSRVNIVLNPISIGGSAVSIRKFPEHPMSMERLVEIEALSPEVARLLQILTQAKYNIFISGGTGSGKTTFLNALSQYIPDDERIITIEDSAELQILGAKNIVKQTSESKAESTEGGNAIENPLVKVQKVKASGILSQVVDESTVSGNSIDTSARVSGRSLHKGTGGWSESGDDWYAKVLMQQYILTYMSCYTDTNPNHALNYEVEYIIGGRASDKDNLKIVIAEILAMRSAANMAYLAGSASKQAQAMALAAIIGGITLTPEVIEGVEKGILAAWAFCESVLDLRALLDGDKIPLIKSDTSWTSSLYGMTSMLTGQVKAKSSNEGIGYKSYLGMLLFTKSMKNIAYRSMDVQEATVRMTGAHESFRMDNAICELSTDVSYKYHGIFLCFVNLLDGADNEYTIKNKAKYSYYGR